MAKQKKLKKWTQVYPQGTKAGDEEQRFFIALGRHPKYKWRSTSAISKEANLTKERVEEIIQKYYKPGLVVQNPQNEDQWGYWERLDQPDDDDEGKTVVQKDHEKRIKKVLNPSSQGGSCGNGGCSSCTPSKSSKSSPSVSFPMTDSITLTSMENYIKDADDVGRALSYVTGDSKWAEESGTDWIVCDSPVADIHNPEFANFAPRQVFYVDVQPQDAEVFLDKLKDQFFNKKNTIQQWDFQTELGDTIKEKYEKIYNVVEVSNLRSDGGKAIAFAPEELAQEDERAWSPDL